MFKVNNSDTRKMCKICSKLTIKTAERRQISSKGRSSVFIVNFEYVSHFSNVSNCWLWTSKCWLGCSMKWVNVTVNTTFVNWSMVRQIKKWGCSDSAYHNTFLLPLRSISSWKSFKSLQDSIIYFNLAISVFTWLQAIFLGID